MAIVLAVGDSVAVFVRRLAAVGNAVAVGVHEALVDYAVAVVVDAVAHLGLRFRSVAPQLPLSAILDPLARTELVLDDTLPAVDAFVDLTVAVIVHPVADFQDRDALDFECVDGVDRVCVFADVDRVCNVFARFRTPVRQARTGVGREVLRHFVGGDVQRYEFGYGFCPRFARSIEDGV